MVPFHIFTNFCFQDFQHSCIQVLIQFHLILCVEIKTELHAHIPVHVICLAISAHTCICTALECLALILRIHGLAKIEAGTYQTGSAKTIMELKVLTHMLYTCTSCTTAYMYIPTFTLWCDKKASGIGTPSNFLIWMVDQWTCRGRILWSVSL